MTSGLFLSELIEKLVRTTDIEIWNAYGISVEDRELCARVPAPAPLFRNSRACACALTFAYCSLR